MTSLAFVPVGRLSVVPMSMRRAESWLQVAVSLSLPKQASQRSADFILQPKVKKNLQALTAKVFVRKSYALQLTGWCWALCLVAS